MKSARCLIDVDKIVLSVLFLLRHLFRGASRQLHREPLEGGGRVCPSSLSPSPQHSSDHRSECLLANQRGPPGTAGRGALPALPPRPRCGPQPRQQPRPQCSAALSILLHAPPHRPEPDSRGAQADGESGEAAPWVSPSASANIHTHLGTH